MVRSVSSNKEKAVLFQLKGGLYTLTALQLFTTDLGSLEEPLNNTIQQAPKFFYQAPIIIDLSKLNSADNIEFSDLHILLKKLHLTPVGIKGGTLDQQEAAKKAGFAIVSQQHTTEKKPSNTQFVPDAKALELQNTPTRLITEPIRSGQQVYARGGDLIIIGSVSQGAELLADGHIHVYGALRGRALAGVTGDNSARIFCQSLEAELLSIAGHYKLSEDIEKIAWKVATEISLQEERLQFRPL